MKALKHIAGILLATIGAGFVLGCIDVLLDRNSEIQGWGVAAMFIVFALLPLAGAVALLRRRVTELPPARCPTCGGGERAAAGVLKRAYNFWLMHFAGWLFASLWGASREQQVRCIQCDTLYFTETRGTRTAGIMVWVLILLVLLEAIAELFEK